LGIVVDPDPPEALRSDVDHAVDGCPMKAIRWEPRPN
jgi:ferredoxin